MTKDEAIKELKACELMGEEEGHRTADIVLADLLIELGYEDVVHAYDKVDKWFS